jgi:integrase
VERIGSRELPDNLYGFWNEQTFLTKSGDLGIVLRVRGVDCESLDQTAQEYAVKRLEVALKTFGVGFHLRHTYTTLLTQNNEEVKVVQELLRHANSRITLDFTLRRECRTNGWHKANWFGWCSTREKHWP